MSDLDRSKNYYSYVFSNGVRQTMTPVEAHQYKERLKIDILQGPGWEKARRQKSFDGFGFHDGLRMTFKGPAHYRQYLKENNLHEAGLGDRPTEHEYKPPRWDEDLIRQMVQNGMEIGSVLAEALLNGELDYPEDA